MISRNYATVKTESHLTRFVDKLLSEDRPFAFDIETGYKGPLRAKAALQHYSPDYVVAGFSFTNHPDWARYVSIAHDSGPNLDTLHVARELWRLLRSGKGVAHNALMELSGLGRFFRDNLWDDDTAIPGTEDKTSDDPEKGWASSYKSEVRASDGLYPVLSDTMLESMLVGENKKKDLKTLSKEILGIQQMEIMELFRSRPELKGLNAAGKYVKYNSNNIRFNVLPLEDDVVAYACEDSVTSLLHHQRNYDLVKDLLIFKTELRLTPILVRMEKAGLLLDWAEYERRQREVERFRDLYAEYVMDRFSEIVGEPVNINLNSPAQVADVLFNRMGIVPTMFTDGGKSGTPTPSTGEKAMRMLLAKHPEIKSLLQYREIAKLLSSYINKYLNELRYDPSGRAHPSHKQEGAGTGRFSVDGVSYQQWPKPYHYELPSGQSLDLNYRNFLIAPEDHRIVGFDYANVELRIIAGLAQERALIEAFANGVDVHKQTASLMLRVPLDEVTDKQRSVGKVLNFAIAYGSGADNIATLITAATGEVCTLEQAESYLDQYFASFSDLKAWMDQRVLEGRTANPVSVKGAAAHWVTTAFGRKIPIFEYQSEFRNVRNKGDRNAVNGPVQGAAADYMKIAMVRADKAIKEAEKNGVIPVGSLTLIMTIHDALEFYVHKSVSTRTVIDILEPAVSYSADAYIPSLPLIRADWHEGYRWGSVAEIEQDESGKILYKRKLELPDKTKETFVSDSLDQLVADIEKFWEQRNTNALDAQIVEEVEFDYDPEEDELFVPDTSNREDVVAPSVVDSPVEEEPLSRQEKLALHAAFQEDDSVGGDVPVWAHSPEPTRLRLTLADMPTTATWPAFQSFLKARPGAATLVVQTPQGEVTLENVGLTPDHEAEIRLIFGSATLALDKPVFDATEVLKDMTL